MQTGVVHCNPHDPTTNVRLFQMERGHGLRHIDRFQHGGVVISADMVYGNQGWELVIGLDGKCTPTRVFYVIEGTLTITSINDGGDTRKVNRGGSAVVPAGTRARCDADPSFIAFVVLVSSEWP